jgi:Domain of unknown function (DUF1877)
MGMSGNFVALSADDFESILEQPKRAIQLVEMRLEDTAGATQRFIDETRRLSNDPNVAPGIRERYKMLLQTMEADFSSKSKVDGDWNPGSDVKCLDVDKSWDALNALLMLNEPEGSPLGFILGGGQEIPTDDFGYGPPHGFTPEQTKEIAAKLEDISSEKLVSLENLKELDGQDLYCFSVDEEEVEYLRNYLGELKVFIAEAAKANQALIVYLA